MKVYCGFLEPIICFYKTDEIVSSESEYWAHITSKSQFIGKSIFEHTIPGEYTYGVTNDGAFYVLSNWDEHQPQTDFMPLLDFITKYVFFPLQMISPALFVRQIEPVLVFRGEKDQENIVNRVILDNRQPTGSLIVDRFERRISIKDFLKNTIFSNFSIENKMLITSTWPISKFINIQKLLDTTINCEKFYQSFPGIRIDLLSLFISLAAEANLREAYYTGIMFLDELFIKIITDANPSHGTTFLGKTFGERTNHIQQSGLIGNADFLTNYSSMNDLRNDVFHRAIIPSIENIFTLHKVIKAILLEKYNFDLQDLGILIRDI